MSDFARGARIKPKPPQAAQRPINEEMPLIEFLAYTAIYLVRDYKIRDKAVYLDYASRAFDAAMRAVPTSEKKP